MIYTGLYSSKAKKLLNIFVNADIDDEYATLDFVDEILSHGIVKTADTGEVVIDGFLSSIDIDASNHKPALKEFSEFIKEYVIVYGEASIPITAEMLAGIPKRSMKVNLPHKTLTRAGYYGDDKTSTVCLYDVLLLCGILAGNDLSRWEKTHVDKMTGAGLNPVQYEMAKSLDEEIKSMRRSLAVAINNMEGQMNNEIDALRSKWQDKIKQVQAEWHAKIAEVSKLKRKAKSKQSTADCSL